VVGDFREGAAIVQKEDGEWVHIGKDGKKIKEA